LKAFKIIFFTTLEKNGEKNDEEKERNKEKDDEKIFPER
jgi:hypothetical protein